jgi:hypothetical protein
VNSPVRKDFRQAPVATLRRFGILRLGMQRNLCPKVVGTADCSGLIRELSSETPFPTLKGELFIDSHSGNVLAMKSQKPI